MRSIYGKRVPRSGDCRTFTEYSCKCIFTDKILLCDEEAGNQSGFLPLEFMDGSDCRGTNFPVCYIEKE